MEELLVKVFDFSIRIIELSKYLDEEKKPFPMIARLLESSEGICVSLRAAAHLPNSTRAYCTQAYLLALEAECLLELMVKTSFLSELQSIPVLTDCRHIISETAQQLSPAQTAL